MKRHASRLASIFVLAVLALQPDIRVAPAMAQNLSAQVAERSATFTIENMTCALCPITVRKAMESVAGVSSVEVDFERKIATVVFDPVVTDIVAIAAAATDAGYPARPGS